MTSAWKATLYVLFLVTANVACDSSPLDSSSTPESEDLSNPDIPLIASSTGVTNSTGSNTTTSNDSGETDLVSEPAPASDGANTNGDNSNTSSDSEVTDGGSGASASVNSSVSLDLSDLPESNLSVLIDTDGNHCLEVGETTTLSVSGVLFDINNGFEELDLTAHATPALENHPSVRLLSHGDDSISLTVTRRDIVDLTVHYQNQFDRIFISALDQDAHKPVIIKKQYQDTACSFALYTDNGCAVIASHVGVVSANVEGIIIEADGCDLNSLPSIPVVTVE